MKYETIRYDISDQLLTITLNRPEQLNAFTVQMANELVDAFERASADDEVRAIIVTGAGKAFCAGMDLSKPGNVFGLDETQQPTLQDMDERLDDPAIIAGVRDTGGRVTLAMDVRLASEKACIGFVFGKIGIVPEACSSWFLPRIVGISQALEWIYSADIFDAAEAQRGGLIKKAVAPENLLDEARAIARRFIENRSPVATALARQMLYRNSAAAHPLAAHRVDSLAMFYSSIGDGKEGVQAFLEKRAPQFEARVPNNLPPFYDEWVRSTTGR